MQRQTISKIQSYLRSIFKSKEINVQGRENNTDSAEVLLNDEFLGVIFEDKDDGETCYHFNMTILDIDLENK